MASTFNNPRCACCGQEIWGRMDVGGVGDAARGDCAHPGGYIAPQPPPIPNEKPASWDLVIGDMKARDAFGRNKYGTPLQPHNGRDTLSDAYQEALDLAVYLRTLLYERDGK